MLKKAVRRRASKKVESADEWSETKLGDLIDIEHGFAFKGSLIHDKPYGDVLLTPGNVAIGGGFKSDKFKYYNGPVSEEFVLREGDVFVTMTDLSKQSDTLGYPAFVPACKNGRRYLHNQRLGKIALKDADRIDRKYIYYVMCGAEYRREVLASATGTTVKHTSPGRIKQFRFLLAPLPEQRAIAHILGTLDDKLELNRRMNETLEGMARALFRSWFVDFDPVHAKAALTRHVPNNAPVQGKTWTRERARAYLDRMDPDNAALFPDRFEESELGPIPKGWKVRRIEDMAERVAMGPFGSSIRVATFVEEGIPVISGQHLNGTLLDDTEYRFITKPHAEKLARANVQRGDVIFTHAGSIGQVAYIPQTSRFKRYVISQRQFYMRCDLVQISPLFVVYFFKTVQGQHQLLCNTSSTGVPSIASPVTYLRSIRLCLPPKTLWGKFDNFVGGLHLKVGLNSAESSILAALRDTLLPKLVLGEMRVRDIDDVSVSR